ncbi:hypothetical protein WJX72_001124 [[Myrmecia] bisecta]|uniref:Ubiquitin-like domain-containing protein n=1 Tax=[Myrmecia] bisecta TaxID=41462 RepID=A0AAW1PAF5_9CHLO
MQLTITTDDDRIVTVEVDANSSAATLKAILEVETAIPASGQLLLLNGRPLDNSGTLASAGVQNGDLLMLMHRDQATQAAAANQQPQWNADGSAVHPEMLMRQMAASAASMADIGARNPALATAIHDGNVEVFQHFLRSAHTAKQQQDAARQREIDLMNADPFDPEVQRKIAEAIEEANVKENFDQAWEHSPEVFSDVVMLYVNMEVNGIPLKAFVDSGAQRTIMSASCAQRCGIMRLLDKRFAGVARGVGTSKILGRVHAAPLKVAGEHLSGSITVLESNDMEFLFGLDMLRRHQCCIDLKNNLLRFGSCPVSLPFLAEHELPMHLRSEAALAAEGQGAASTSGGTGALAHPESAARRQLHTTWKDGSEMLEEYDLKTAELLLRKRRSRTTWGKDGEWEYLVGDPPAAWQPDKGVLKENSQNPILTRRDTPQAFQWRIRNLPYPRDVFDVSVDAAENKIVVRTSNKKYFKKLSLPELEALKLPLTPAQLQYTHANNTLIVSYAKPLQVLEAEEREREENRKLAADGNVDCKQQ